MLKRSENKKQVFWTVSVTLAFLLPVLSFAQLDTGSISGSVADSTGSVVGSVKITAKETATGTSYTTVSSRAGYYVFPAVHTGVYTVTLSSPGFKTGIYTGVTVSVGASSAHNFVLEVGDVSESVSVNTSALTLETETSDVGTSIQPEQVLDLPLAVTGALRSLSTLTFLTPGSVGPGTSPGGAGGQIIAKINGGQTLGSDYLVDGISTLRSENGSGGFDGLSPSVEAVPGVPDQHLCIARRYRTHHGRYRQLRHPQWHKRLSRHGIRLLQKRCARRQQLVQQWISCNCDDACRSREPAASSGYQE